MKVGVIGTGNMGENHVRTYLQVNNHCQLVGVYDNDERRRRQVAEKYDVKAFESLDGLLQKVDAVSIAVPTESHYKVGLACTAHHVHMLMEKPITDTVAQAKNLIHQSKQAGVKLQMGHIELFNPFIQVLKKELEHETVLGMLLQRFSPESNRLKNIDVVNDLMIHDLYIVESLLQDNLVTFKAHGKVENNAANHAAVIATSSGGVTAQLTASFKSRKKVRMIQILTEDAFIEADILNGCIEKTRSVAEETHQWPIPISETIQVDQSIQPLTLQLLHFIQSLKNHTEPAISGEDGLKTLMMTQLISESIRDT